MTITTAMCYSFKQEVLQGGHCFNAPITTTATAATTSLYTAVAGGLSGVSVGMSVTGTNVAAGTVVAAITGPSAFTASLASTGAVGSITISGDTFKMALIKSTSTATYSGANVNYSDVLVTNTDEVTGTGYSAGGVALGNVGVSLNATSVAITNFSPNPSWTTASFSTMGCMIYNSSTRNGGTSGTNTTGTNRACGVFDFGGTQTVNNGTFTVVMPAASATSAILRIA